MRSRYIGLLIFLGAVLVLLLIWRPGKAKERPVRPPQPAPVRSITYSVEVFREEEESGSPLAQKLADANNPFERTVYFDGKRSCTQERRTGYDFRGTRSTIRDSAAAYETVVLQFPWGAAWYRKNGEASAPLLAGTVRRADDGKTILGHRCEKIVITAGQAVQTVWFAPGLQLSDPTYAVVQDSLVPGLILELDTHYGPRMGNYHVRSTVTALDLEGKQDRSVFRVPPGAQKAAGPEEVPGMQKELLKTLEARSPMPPEEKDRFLGNWRLSWRGDRIDWQIGRFGADTYTLTEIRSLGGKRARINRGILHFYGDRMVIEDGATFRSYLLAPDGRLQQEDEPEFAFRKR